MLFRVDLWSVYVDQETKSGNIDKARNLLQRALSIGLKKKLVFENDKATGTYLDENLLKD